MKKFLPLLLILSIAPAAFCLAIQASISDVYTTELKYFSYNDSAQRFDAEVFNTGSIPYAAQLHLEVSNDSYYFQAWSNKRDMMPGNSALYHIYWIPNATGEYKAKARIYYSGEILEKEFNISIQSLKGYESAFEILSTKTYQNFILVNIASSKDASDAAIIPMNFPRGWIIEQASSKDMKQGSTKQVLIQYDPSVWSRQMISIGILSLDGKYYSTQDVRLERERGLGSMIFNMMYSFMAH